MEFTLPKLRPGEKAANAVLTDDIVRRIRWMRSEGFSPTEVWRHLADGGTLLNKNTVAAVFYWKAWRHVT